MKSKSSKPSTSIDSYLEDVDPKQRAALQRLRSLIRAAAPAAEECISYGMPAFRLHGKAIAGFSSSRNHCSFFPMSGSTVACFQEELRGFDTSKGTIRFQPDKPIPEPLVRKLVKSRIADVQPKKR